MRAHLAMAAIGVAALIVTIGCKGGDAPAPSTTRDAAPSPRAPQDAGATSRPMGDYHLDDDPASSSTVPTRRRRATRPIEIILRSTPPGATAAVDGQPIGKTPTYWAGTADGRPHEFTFSMPGHALARYRFVATRDGIVHGSLRKLAQRVDAGPSQ